MCHISVGLDMVGIPFAAEAVHGLDMSRHCAVSPFGSWRGCAADGTGELPDLGIEAGILAGAAFHDVK